MAPFGTKTVRLNLALQGGGTHGAFTWGVLERLCEVERLELATISATSAGAINAVALAAGLQEAGTEGAKRKLTAVWTAIHKTALPDFARLPPFLRGLPMLEEISAASMAQLAATISPYEFNPFDFNPLKALLEEHIDFERLSTLAAPQLLIAATDIATGRSRLFGNAEITVDTVLASTCLPSVHRAVEIGGRNYWDGGFSANPDLVELVRRETARDTLIVLLTPMRVDAVPTRAGAIAGEMNRITFNQPFLRDVQMIEAWQSMSRRNWFCAEAPEARAARRHRFHLIDAGAHTASLSHESKIHPDWPLLSSLHQAGRDETEAWLASDYASVGRKATVNLPARFLGP